jgi:hypothetical protein
MQDDRDKREGQTGEPAKNSRGETRQDRLKLALRENLKRRKSQARGRSDVTAASSDGADASLDDEDENKPNG